MALGLLDVVNASALRPWEPNGEPGDWGEQGPCYCGASTVAAVMLWTRIATGMVVHASDMVQHSVGKFLGLCIAWLLD